MAWIDEKMIVNGARGNLGRQFVFRRRGNKTFIERMPMFNKNRKPTAGQVNARNSFTAAAAFAKSVIASPALKRIYAQQAGPGIRAYNIAFRDYLKAPEIKSIDATNYDGKPGSEINIIAIDDFRVVGVVICIKNASGELIEKGNAFLDPLNLDRWIYRTTQFINDAKGCHINVLAYDLPGNEARAELVIT